MTHTYKKMISQLRKAGFEFHCHAVVQDGPEGQIFINKKGARFDGEVVDIFEDGSHTIWSPFPGVVPKFKFK
jgi:hypothetical protein